jgi:hypothetical protein
LISSEWGDKYVKRSSAILKGVSLDQKRQKWTVAHLLDEWVRSSTFASFPLLW